MSLINWNENLSVQIPTIDEEHKKLFEYINDFYNGIHNKSSDDNLLKLIMSLIDFTDYHFATEEKLMIEHNYPDYDDHKKEHDNFKAKVNDTHERLKNGKLVVNIEIINFLKKWIIDHIMVKDKKYVPLFLEKGVK